MAERMHDAHHIEHMRKKREGQKRRRRHQEEERKKREKEIEKKKKEREEHKHSGHAHEKKSSRSGTAAKVREHTYVACVSSPAISAPWLTTTAGFHPKARSSRTRSTLYSSRSPGGCVRNFSLSCSRDHLLTSSLRP